MSVFRRNVVAFLALLLVLVLPTPLLAHEGGSVAGFFSGLQHPVSGLDHVLAMVAVGLWGAQLGQPAIWVLPVTFPIVMALGGMLGLLGVPLPAVELGIGLSAVILGGAVASEARPKLVVAAVFVGFFAIFHGYAHGTELPDGQSGLSYSLGFVMSTGLLHGAGIALGLVHRWDLGKDVIRVAGAGIALGGLLFTYNAWGG